MQIEKEASKSDDLWQQLILGCVGFVNGANAKENSMSVLQKHIEDLKACGYLRNDVDVKLMTYAISGALNELALNYSQHEAIEADDRIICTVSQLVSGFMKSQE